MKYVTLWASLRLEQQLTTCNAMAKRNAKIEHFKTCCHLLFQVKDHWDLWLDSIIFAYNTSRHDVLGVSPYEVVFGRAPRLPLELELGMPLSNPITRSEYMHTLRLLFRNVRQIAKQQLTKVSEKRAGHKQETNTCQPFCEGETVMLRRPKGWKLGSKWVEPYRIPKRVGVNYKIV